MYITTITYKISEIQQLSVNIFKKQLKYRKLHYTARKEAILSTIG